jgi:putative transposase
MDQGTLTNSDRGWERDQPKRNQSTREKNQRTGIRKRNLKKSDRHIRQKTLIDKVGFIKLFKHIYPIKTMCKVLKLNRSTVYKIINHKISQQEINRLDLESRVIDIYNDSKQIYGAPKITKVLEKQGYHTSQKRVSRYMKRLGIKSIVIRKYRPQANSKAPDGKENIMNQDFSTTEINQKWAMDITYIPTVYDGWTYLASIEDLHAKIILGYCYSKNMKQEIVIESLKQSVYRSGPTKDIMIQSDLGSQYLSYEVEEFLNHHGMIHSYSRKGTPYDNSPMESFHSILKKELIHRNLFKTYEEARIAIFEFIEGWYNRNRIHSSIGYQTPYQVYYSK